MKTVDRAREMLDIPFLHQGRDRHGIDCIGLLAYACEYPTAQIPAYPRDPLRNQLEQHLDTVLGAPVLTSVGVGKSALQVGDIVAMAYTGATRHVGLVAQHPQYPGELSLIHTDSRLGRVTEHILDEKWLRRIRRVYRS